MRPQVKKIGIVFQIFKNRAEKVAEKTIYPAKCLGLPPHALLRNLKFADSPLEGSGFELPVPREISSGFEASAESRPIDRLLLVSSEQSSASANQQSCCDGSRSTTHRRMKTPTLMAVARHRGTEFSNPFPSSGESANFHRT